MLREQDFEKAEREIERLTKENQELLNRIKNLEKEVAYLDAFLQGRRPG
jgi:cell division protein FtsB